VALLLGGAACEGRHDQLGPGIPPGVPSDAGAAFDLGAGRDTPVSEDGITVTSPSRAGAYRGSAPIEIMIAAGLLDPGGAPEAKLGDQVLALTAGDAAGQFRGTIGFDNFNPPLSGPQLLRVTVRRGAETKTVAVPFVVDDLGPDIVETSPKAGLIFGGVIKVEARITDPAGVEAGSPVAFIGNKAGLGFQLPLVADAKDPALWSAAFDTRALTSCDRLPDNDLCVVWPNVSFRARDKLGNEATVAYDIGIDNQPPTLDLDSAPIRILKHDPILGDICSHEFDPLGASSALGDMPNDLCGVGQLFDLRARIEDNGNAGAGIKGSPIATVDPKTVVAYVLDDTTQPLAVDMDGDGICDDVNPTLLPTAGAPLPPKPLLAVRLIPVAPTGGGDYTPDATATQCRPGIDLQPPERLCSTTDLTQVIGYPQANGPEPAIWGLEPTFGDWCVGAQFDVQANEIADGWACVAVVAEDRVGNRSVSQALRVYVDRKGSSLIARPGTCPAPPPGAGPPPDCTGRFDRKTGLVSPQPCRSWRFPAGEIRFQHSAAK
jgi:hypothetical protein